VSVLTRFERFPATIKGAFVLTSADPDPHAARIVRAEIARIPSGAAKPFSFTGDQVEVAPGRDLFVPFEATIADLAPSWYVVRSEVRVDGGGTWEHVSRPFAIAWPRSAVRTGIVTVDADVRVERRAIRIERIEMRGDRTEVTWRPPVGGPDPTFSVAADGVLLEGLPPAATGHVTGADAATGRRRSAYYPTPKGARSLEVRVRVGSTEAAKPLRFPLA